MLIKKSIATILGVCLLSLSSCSTAVDGPDSGTSSDVSVTASSSVTSMTYPDDPIPDDYIRDAVIPDGEYPCRAYKDQLILHSDGKEYIAVGNYSAKKFTDYGELDDCFVQYSDEDLEKLKVGDEFVYDRDIRFKIESLEIEDWTYKNNDPDYPLIPNGIIHLNDEYALRHGTIDYGKNHTIISDEDSKKWVLMHKDDIDGSDCLICVVDSVKLVEYSNNCKFSLRIDGERDVRNFTKEQLSSVFDEYITSGRSFCWCEITVRNNKVVKLFLDVNGL